MRHQLEKIKQTENRGFLFQEQSLELQGEGVNFRTKPAAGSYTSQLIEQVLDGSDIAFEKLYLQNVSRIRGIVCRHAASDADIEQLVQDAFIKAYYGLHCLRDATKFGAWLSKIACHVAIEDGRSSKRRYHDLLSEHLPANGPGQYDTLYQKEVLEAVEIVLRDLPAFKRRLMNYVQLGYSDKEISVLLGRTIPSVKLHKHRIRKFLTEILSPN